MAPEEITIVVVAAPDPEPFLLMVIGTTVLLDEVVAIEMTEMKIGNEIVNETETEIETGRGTAVVTEKVTEIARENRGARVHNLMRMNVTVALCLFSNLLHV